METKLSIFGDAHKHIEDAAKLYRARETATGDRLAEVKQLLAAYHPAILRLARQQAGVP